MDKDELIGNEPRLTEIFLICLLPIIYLIGASIGLLLYATLIGPRFFQFAYDLHLINETVNTSDSINYCLNSLLTVMLLLITILLAYAKKITGYLEKRFS